MKSLIGFYPKLNESDSGRIFPLLLIVHLPHDPSRNKLKELTQATCVWWLGPVTSLKLADVTSSVKNGSEKYKAPERLEEKPGSTHESDIW